MSLSHRSARWIFIAAVSVGTILKTYCASTTYGTNDTGLFQLYGQALYEAGLEETYKASQHFNHTPALSIVLVGLYWLSKTFGWSFPLLLRLPGIAADVVTSLVLWRLVSKQMPAHLSPVWLCLFALNPVSFMVSGYHGNFDSVIAMFVFLAAYYSFRERIDLSSLFFALAVHVKVAPLILAPAFFFFWYGRGKGLRFLVATTCLLLSLWTVPLIQYPALLLQRVFGYGSYWGIWGITYWLRETGYPAFYLVSFYGLNAIQNAIMTFLKIVVAAGILVLAWKRARLGPASIFATLSYSFAIFFTFAPGVLLHYLAWPSCLTLLHARKWYLVLLTASSVFLFRCYTVINNGLPWDKGLFTVQVLNQWIAWSNIPWLAYLCFLGYFILKSGRPNPNFEAAAS
jgi:Gpi18-like mannosyltransferase